MIITCELCLGGVTLSIISSSVVDHGSPTGSYFTLDNWYLLLLC